jgi:two-component system sensor histidine kinase MtrB
MRKPRKRSNRRPRKVGLLPWHKMLVFRFGLILALSLVAFDLVRPPILEFVMRALGLDDAGGTAYFAAGTALSVVVAVALAALLAYVLSRWLTARLTRLSEVAGRPVQDGELPGPFDESGDDEIAIVAGTMNAMRKQVESRLRELSLRDIRRREFIAQVSHDLRTPLTAQLACLDRAGLLLEKPDGQFNRQELQELLAVAKLDADRVHTLADDLLEIARLDAGDRLTLEPVPPGELVRQAARALEPMASQRAIEIEVRVTAGLPMLHADGRRLTRAFENLLRNAIQHARSEVVVMAVLVGDCVRFEVRDDGRGLPKEADFLDYLRRLNKDVRLSKLAKRRSGPDSAGLGLVVAQRVAEAHNGIVDAYDLRGSGAAFFIDIPVPEDRARGETEAETMA